MSKNNKSIPGSTRSLVANDRARRWSQPMEARLAQARPDMKDAPAPKSTTKTEKKQPVR